MTDISVRFKFYLAPNFPTGRGRGDGAKMNIRSRPIFIFFLLMGIFSFNYISSAWSAVIVFDSVTTPQTPVYLKVKTKQHIFSRGGQRVSVKVGDTSLGTLLTGGDGFGYLKYTPGSAGLQTIRCTSGNNTGEGSILVLEKWEKVVVIEIDSVLLENLLSTRSGKGGNTALKTLSKEFKLIYFSKLSGMFNIKKWMESREFPVSVILHQQGAKTLKRLNGKGINLYAVIGSSAFMVEAKEYCENRLTFEKTKYGTTVKSWDDILQHLIK